MRDAIQLRAAIALTICLAFAGSGRAWQVGENSATARPVAAQLLNLELPDETYTKVSRYGLQITSTFALKPGKYTVRQVLRESEGAQIAAKNEEVVIP